MRRHLTWPAVLIAVVALVIGSLGTATASGLTKHTVKRLATKVVVKQAPTLSVAHASTADTLGGKTAAQLATTGYQYVLPFDSPATNKHYAFPGLPDGTYLVSYAVVGHMTTANSFLSCGLFQPSAPNHPQHLATSGSVSGSFSKTSASGIVAMDASYALSCTASASTTFTIDAQSYSTVSFVPIDALVTGSPVSSRVASGS